MNKPILVPNHINEEADAQREREHKEQQANEELELEKAAEAPVDLEYLNQLMRTHLWGILIQPLTVKKFSDGGIKLPDQHIQAQEYLTTIGEVVQLGKFANSGKTASGIDLAQDPIEVGNWVVIQRHTGQDLPRLKTGQRLRVVETQNILVVITNPSEFVIY